MNLSIIIAVYRYASEVWLFCHRLNSMIRFSAALRQSVANTHLLTQWGVCLRTIRHPRQIGNCILKSSEEQKQTKFCLILGLVHDLACASLNKSPQPLPPTTHRHTFCLYICVVPIVSSCWTRTNRSKDIHVSIIMHSVSVLFFFLSCFDWVRYLGFVYGKTNNDE